MTDAAPPPITPVAQPLVNQSALAVEPCVKGRVAQIRQRLIELHQKIGVAEDTLHGIVCDEKVGEPAQPNLLRWLEFMEMSLELAGRRLHAINKNMGAGAGAPGNGN